MIDTGARKDKFLLRRIIKVGLSLAVLGILLVSPSRVELTAVQSTTCWSPAQQDPQPAGHPPAGIALSDSRFWEWNDAPFAGHTQTAESKASADEQSSDLVIGTTSGGTTSGGWHQEAHDAQHTGFINLPVPMPWEMAWQWNGSCSDGSDCRPGNPEQGWSFEVPPKSHLVAGGGRLYLPSGDHGVWAINQSDGRTAWHNDSIDSFCTAAFDPEANALFVAGSDGKLYKLNSSNGAIVDSFQADSDLNLAPIIAVGRVYVVSDSGTLYAVDKHTVNLVWSYAAGSAGQTPAAYAERYDVLVFGTEDLYVHAVDNSDGSLHWQRKPSLNVPGDFSYDGGDGRRHRTYNYEHGWPVIAEEHGIVLIRLHQPNSAIWQVPDMGAGYWYPSSNQAIRDFLVSHPDLQTLFALNLTDGSDAFIPAVGCGGIDTPELQNGSTLGPLPVVRVLPNGDEVVYTTWRNGQKCEAGDCSDARWDAVMGEMVLDDSTVPGYQAGDCRFVSFGPEGHSGRDLITDEMGKLSMAADTILHSHWILLSSYRITDRGDSLGNTYSNPIKAERQPYVVNRGSNEPDWVPCEPDPSHYCSGHLDTHGDRRVFLGAFWVFFNHADPPYQACTGPDCVDAYTDGYKARYTIVDNGTIFYELNGGSIFALRSKNEPLAEVDKQVWPRAPSNGDTITYTVNVLGSGNPLTLTDTLPDGLSTPDTIDHTLGTVNYDPARRLVTWTGTPEVGQLVAIRFPVSVQVDGPLALVNTAVLIDTDRHVFTDTAIVIVDAYQCCLPLVMRSY